MDFKVNLVCTGVATVAASIASSLNVGKERNNYKQGGSRDHPPPYFTVVGK